MALIQFSIPRNSALLTDTDLVAATLRLSRRSVCQANFSPYRFPPDTIRVGLLVKSRWMIPHLILADNESRIVEDRQVDCIINIS